MISQLKKRSVSAMKKATPKQSYEIAMKGPDVKRRTAVDLANQIKLWFQQIKMLPEGDRNFRIFRSQKPLMKVLIEDGNTPYSKDWLADPRSRKAFIEGEAMEIAEKLLLWVVESCESRTDTFFAALGGELSKEPLSATEINIHAFCQLYCYGVEMWKRHPEQKIVPKLQDVQRKIRIRFDVVLSQQRIARIFEDLGLAYVKQKIGRPRGNSTNSKSKR